jgi:hypothetical protein
MVRRPARTYVWCIPRSLLARSLPFADGQARDQITTVVDTTAHISLRWRAIQVHASQTPPYDLMSPELQHAFLAADHFVRVDPPFNEGAVERDWIPDVTHR